MFPSRSSKETVTTTISTRSTAREDTTLMLHMAQLISLTTQLQLRILRIWSQPRVKERSFVPRLLSRTRFELDLPSPQQLHVPHPPVDHRAHSPRSQKLCGQRRLSQDSGLPLKKSPCLAQEFIQWLPLALRMRISITISTRISPSSRSIRPSMSISMSIQAS